MAATKLDDTWYSSNGVLNTKDYLELRMSYQEDVRLGIFSAAEAKAHMEDLEKRRMQAEKEKSVEFISFPSMRQCITPDTNLYPLSHLVTYPRSRIFQHGLGSSSNFPHLKLSTPTPVSPPDPLLEPLYEEKAATLGFRKPMQSHPLSKSSCKELFKAILDHAAECDLAECRLDSRMSPHLISYSLFLSLFLSLFFCFF